MKLIIDRQKWLRGEGPSDFGLFRPADGKMCCLGFYCQALGATQKDMSIASRPFVLQISKSRKVLTRASWLNEYSYQDANSISNLVIANDSPNFSEEEREQKIVEEFAKHGVEVIFEN